MRRSTANTLQAILVAIQPLIPLLPVPEHWKPFAHAVPAAIQMYVATVQHNSKLDGTKLEAN